MKKIIHNETEFELKDYNDLSVRQASVPLLIKYKKLSIEYLGDFDTTLIDKHTDKIAMLKTAISQIENKPEDAEYKAELELKLQLAEQEFKSDTIAQNLLEAKQEIEALIIIELSLEIELMKKLFSKILIGDVSKIIYSGEQYTVFAMEVLDHFFTRMLKNKSG